MFTTSGTYPWSFVTQIFHIGQPSYGGYCKIGIDNVEVGENVGFTV